MTFFIKHRFLFVATVLIAPFHAQGTDLAPPILPHFTRVDTPKPTSVAAEQQEEEMTTNFAGLPSVVICLISEKLNKKDRIYLSKVNIKTHKALVDNAKKKVMESIRTGNTNTYFSRERNFKITEFVLEFLKKEGAAQALKSFVVDGNGISVFADSFAKFSFQDQDLLSPYVTTYHSTPKFQTPVEIISQFSHLKDLKLAHNDISDVEVTQIAEALKTSTTLENLTLYGNKISDVGAKKIAQALESNTTLKRLFLEDNKISITGFQILLKAVITNTFLPLECLSLENNLFCSSECNQMEIYAWAKERGLSLIFGIVYK